jgi:L-rhamnonate dehydratase
VFEYDVAMLSRRKCIAALGTCGLWGQDSDRIVSVKAAPIPLLPTSRFGTAQFKDDVDPARKRWFGPFSQLAGSILVQIRTKEGLTGYGMGGGGSAAVHIIDHHLKDLLVGANPSNIELLWEQMFASSSFYGRRGLPVMAMSGVDLALWDLLGQRKKQPVWQLLGGVAQKSVLSYFTGTDITRAVELGFRALKFGATGDAAFDTLLQSLRNGREALGPKGYLMVDVLCRWDVDTALRFCRSAEPYRLHFLEEPLYPDDVQGYARLVRETRSTKIACGEHEFTHYGFAEIIRNRAAHILQPDLTWTGGLTTARKILDLAKAAKLPLMPHRGGSLFAIHLAIANAEIPMAESFGTAESGNELMELFTPAFEKGRYLAPEKPGLGFEMTDAILKRHAPQLL